MISGNGAGPTPNSNSGIDLVASSHNTIQGNYIGTKPNGTGDLGNANAGILIQSTNQTMEGTVIGGNGDAEKNVICRNRGLGIDDSGDKTLSKKNKIGTDAVGNSAQTPVAA